MEIHENGLTFTTWVKADPKRVAYLLLVDSIGRILNEHPLWTREDHQDQIIEFINRLDCVEETELIEASLTDAVAFRARLLALTQKYDV